MVQRRPAELKATRIDVGGDAYVLLSVPRATWGMLDELTPAERQVALAVLSGLSNAEVARMRGSSPRTIANQLATIFKKLGVHSRAELAARALATASRAPRGSDAAPSRMPTARGRAAAPPRRASRAT